MIKNSVKPLPGLPYFGSMPDMQRDRLGFMLNARKQRGDIAPFRMLGTDFYLLSCPDDIKHVLVDNHKNYTKGLAYQRLKAVLGNGLLTSTGDIWLRQRRLIQPAFHRQKIVNFAGIMTDAASETGEHLTNFARTGEPVNIHAEMMRLTLTVVARALFTAEVGSMAGEIGSAMNTMLENSIRRIERPFTFPLWLPIPEVIGFKNSLQTLNRIVFKIIDDRRRQKTDQGDLLSMLLHAVDEETGKEMNDQQLRDEVMTLFLAGHETTANALSWAWYQLSKSPEIERRLDDELSRVLAGRIPTTSDLPNLPYNRMVIDEILRLYPPAWLLSRAAIGPDLIDGVTIDPQSVVFLCPYVTHRHPEFWTNPEGFDPERFSPEKSSARPPFAYFPFGGGPRQCIGNNFALQEAQLVLATLVQRFRFELVSGSPVVPEPSITLRPKHGIMVRVVAK
jgi:cytochrome P450